MFTRTSAAALNHLLSQNNWALPRLARHAGKTARFDVAPFSFACTILDDGSLLAAGAATEPDVRCVIAPSLLPRLALHDESAHAEIRTEGDAELLKEIFFLSRNLDWDAADDLSHVTGDIAAERIVQAMGVVHRNLRDGAANLAHAAAEYWTEERPLLAKPQQVAAFMQQVDMLRDDAARLEQRIRALSPSPPAPLPSKGEGSRC
jgi:ubiquinone biosynthesis accessory factor UbiJ